MAEVLRDSDRAEDITARYGAEESVLLLNDTPEEAAVVAERVRSETERRCSTKSDVHVKRQIAVSLGIAPLAPNVRTFDGLIEAAGEEMCHAKKFGRYRVSGGRREPPLVSSLLQTREYVS